MPSIGMLRCFTITLLTTSALGLGCTEVNAGMLCVSDDLCITDTAPVVINGNTFTVEGKAYRLWGVDAPKTGHPYHAESIACLRTILRDISSLALRSTEEASQSERVVQAYAVGAHKVKVHANMVTYINDAMQLVDIAPVLISQGCVWYTPRYAPDRDDYRAHEAEAKIQRKGLWAHEHPSVP